MQCSQREYIGNLLGPVPNTQTLMDLEDAIKARPVFISAGITNIRLIVNRHRAFRNFNPNCPKVSDVHVYVEDEHADAAYKFFRRMYPSNPSPRLQYPEASAACSIEQAQEHWQEKVLSQEEDQNWIMKCKYISAVSYTNSISMYQNNRLRGSVSGARCAQSCAQFRVT